MKKKSNVRLIKKYKNRKLYDTFISAHIALEEVSDLVNGGVKFNVICNETKKDVTNQTLLNIIMMKELKNLGKGDEAKQRAIFTSIVKSKDSLITSYVAELKS